MKLIFESEEDLRKYEQRIIEWVETASLDQFPYSMHPFEETFNEAINLLSKWGRDNFKPFASDEFIRFYDINVLSETQEIKNRRKQALLKLTPEERELLGLGKL